MTPQLFKLTALAASSLLLAGCASVNFDQAVSSANQTTGNFTGGKLELNRTTQQNNARVRLAGELLTKPLSSDDAVQLALANSACTCGLASFDGFSAKRAAPATTPLAL